MRLFVSFIVIAIGVGICEGVLHLCCLGDCSKHQELRKAIAGVVGLVVSGLWIRLGYWLAYEGWLDSIVWVEGEGLVAYYATYPVSGWIIMIGGGVMAVVYALRGFYLNREDFWTEKTITLKVGDEVLSACPIRNREFLVPLGRRGKIITEILVEEEAGEKLFVVNFPCIPENPNFIAAEHELMLERLYIKEDSIIDRLLDRLISIFSKKPSP